MHVPRHAHSYRWWIVTAVLVGFGAALGACRGEDTVSSNTDRGNGNPSLSKAISVDPDPTYYEADVHLAVHGGIGRAAGLEHSYHIVRTLHDGAWSVELSNPEPGSPAGERSGSDIARITLTTNPWQMTITTRSGRVLTPSDVPAAKPGIGSMRPDAAWTSEGGGSVGVQRGPLTRDVVGSAGRALVMARLTGPEYSEQPGPAGRRRFERSQGARRVVVEVDAVTGAAVREEVREDGRLVITTNRSYRQAGALVLLDREVTTRFDPAGAPRVTFERRLTNIRTERSR